jgi:hypothetical protein
MFAHMLDTLFNLKAALISAAIFVPVEALIPRRRSQPMRAGWIWLSRRSIAWRLVGRSHKKNRLVLVYVYRKYCHLPII